MWVKFKRIRRPTHDPHDRELVQRFNKFFPELNPYLVKFNPGSSSGAPINLKLNLPLS
jgi:hypothetical protein